MVGFDRSDQARDALKLNTTFADTAGTPARDEAVANPARLAALRATGLLDTRAAPAFDGLTALAQRLLGVAVATVSLVDEDYQHFVSWTGSEEEPAGGRMPLAYSFCRYTVGTGEPLAISDARRSPLVSKSPAVTEGGWVSYAGAPLHTAGGHVLGTLCVLSHEPRDWSEDDERQLSELAAIGSAEIDYRLHSHAMDEIETIARGMKGPIQLLGDSVRTLGADIDGGAPEARIGRLATQARTRFTSVESHGQNLQEALHTRRPEPRPAAQAHLAEAVERAVRLATVSASEGSVDLDLATEDFVTDTDPHALQRALSHLVVSALHHAVDSRPVKVSLARAGDEALLIVVSPGGAMPARALTSVVSRLNEALHGDSEDAVGPCSVALRDGMTIAQANGIGGASGSAGTHVVVRIRVHPRQ